MFFSLYIDCLISDFPTDFRSAKLGNIFHFHKFRTTFLCSSIIYHCLHPYFLFRFSHFFINFATKYGGVSRFLSNNKNITTTLLRI